MVALLKDGKVIGEPTQDKHNNWFTPAPYIEAVREVLGGSIDLDPASCALANETVKARRYFTEAENGLVQVWHAETVFLNPPYGKAIPYTSRGRYMGGGDTSVKSLQTQFVEKALSEYEAGRVKHLILLVTANITVKWFQPLWKYPMCIPFPKISFIVPGMEEKQRQVFGNVFVYLGPYESRFSKVFCQFGPIIRTVAFPSKTFVPLSLWEVAQ